MKKAIIVTPYADPEPGACSLRVQFFCESLSEKGYTPKVFAPKRGTLESTGAVERFRFGLELLVRLIVLRPSLILSVTPPPLTAFIALLAARICGARFVLDAKDDLEFYSDPGSSLKRNLRHALHLFFRRLVYRFSDRIMVLTEADYSEALESYPVPLSRVFLVMNGTNVQTIRRETGMRQITRKKFGFSEKDTVLIYAGSLGDERVIELLENDLVSSQLPFLKLLMVVTFDQSAFGQREIDGIRKTISEKNLQHQVKVVENAPYSEMHRFFSAADLAILPWGNSLKTSIPVKIFDYCAAGLFIAAKCPADTQLSKTLKQFGIGLADEDWPALRQTVLSLTQNKKQLALAGEKNRSLAEKQFDRSVQKTKFFALLQDLLPAGR